MTISGRQKVALAIALQDLPNNEIHLSKTTNGTLIISSSNKSVAINRYGEIRWID